VVIAGATVLEVCTAAPAGTRAFNVRGGGGPFIYTFNDRLSGVVAAGAAHDGSLGDLRFDATFINLLAGPRFLSIHRPVQTPVVTGAPVTAASGQTITARLRASDTAFAMRAGGGRDIKVTRRHDGCTLGEFSGHQSKRGRMAREWPGMAKVRTHSRVRACLAGEGKRSSSPCWKLSR
jgi:hypothetical protein